VPAELLRFLRDDAGDLLGSAGVAQRAMDRAWTGLSPEAVVLQAGPASVLPQLSRLAAFLSQEGKAVFILLQDMEGDGAERDTALLLEAAPGLSHARRILVHSTAGLNRLKEVGLVNNVTLFPYGFPDLPVRDPAEVRSAFGIDSRQVIAAFGASAVGDGARELVLAFAELHRADRSRHLLILPDPYCGANQHAADALLTLCGQVGLEQAVTLLAHPPECTASLLGASDVVVLPFQRAWKDARALVQFGLAAGRPTALTPLPFFDDLEPVTYRLPGTGPDAMAQGLAALLREGGMQESTTARHVRWLREHSWPRLSRRLWNLIRSCTASNGAELRAGRHDTLRT
jgi:glycosyltransferase involved in cell wall biosynthesis